MQDLGNDLGYILDPCPKCGRLRVIAYSGGKHICEKCNWCIEDGEYFDLDRYLEESFSDYWKEIDEIMMGWRK